MPHSSSVSCSSQELNSVDNKLHSHSRKFRFSRACLPAGLLLEAHLFHMPHSISLLSSKAFCFFATVQQRPAAKKELHKQIPRVSPNISRDNIISSIKETFFFLLILLQSHGSIPRTPSRDLTGKYNHTVIVRRDDSELYRKHVIFISGSLAIKVIMVHLRIQCCRTPKTSTHLHKTSYLAICLQPPQKKKPQVTYTAF